MNKMFPIQSQRDALPHPIMIPWSIAELAYSVYSVKYGRDQSLERLAERGGFGPSEMDTFLPGWRHMCSEIEQLKKDSNRLDWMQKMMTPNESYCEIFFAGLRNWNTPDATAFQIESNPPRFPTLNKTTLREAIDEAMKLSDKVI
jgi:hypothetical protein